MSASVAAKPCAVRRLTRRSSLPTSHASGGRAGGGTLGIPSAERDEARSGKGVAHWCTESEGVAGVNGWEDGHGRDVRQSREASRAEAARTDDLEKLAAEIAGAYEARLVTPEGRRPHLRVTNRGAPILREHIYAWPADGEAWWFLFGWAV